MGDSKVLKNHTARHALRADRDFVAFEGGILRSDLSLALKQLANSVLPKGTSSSIMNRIAVQLEQPYDARKLDELREEARQEAWRARHTNQEEAAAALLMLAAFLSGGIHITPKKGEAHDGQGASLQGE